MCEVESISFVTIHCFIIPLIPFYTKTFPVVIFCPSLWERSYRDLTDPYPIRMPTCTNCNIYSRKPYKINITYCLIYLFVIEPYCKCSSICKLKLPLGFLTLNIYQLCSQRENSNTNMHGT